MQFIDYEEPPARTAPVKPAARLQRPEPKAAPRAEPRAVKARRPRQGPRAAFRTWRRSRPFWAGFWTIIGGAAVSVGPLSAIKLVMLAGQVVWMGILVGVLIAIFGLFLWFDTSLRRLISVFILLLGLLSLITSDLGGFLIGMLLTILGGSMGLAWAPQAAPKPAATAAPTAPGPAAPGTLRDESQTAPG